MSEALRAFRRTPLLSTLSVASIGFSLFTIGLFGLVALNFRQTLRTLAGRVEVVAFVLRGPPTGTIPGASSDVQAFPEVLEVRYVSEDEALARARSELVEFKEAYRDLETNPLPASLEIRLKPEFRDAEHARLVAERLHAYPFVDAARCGRDWVERLDRLRNLAAAVGLVIGLAFAIVAIVIIGVTIRITVLQRAGGRGTAGAGPGRPPCPPSPGARGRPPSRAGSAPPPSSPGPLPAWRAPSGPCGGPRARAG